MLGYKGPAQPSPTLGDALNAEFLYLEVRCLGCDTHQTVALGYRAPGEDNTSPRTGALNALQVLLGGPGLSLQGQPSGGAQARKDFSERSAVDLVARGAMTSSFAVIGSHVGTRLYSTDYGRKVLFEIYEMVLAE